MSWPNPKASFHAKPGDLLVSHWPSFLGGGDTLINVGQSCLVVATAAFRNNIWLWVLVDDGRMGYVDNAHLDAGMDVFDDAAEPTQNEHVA